MNLNLDQLAETIERQLPWAFTVTKDGVTYPTTRPTTALVMDIRQDAKAVDISRLFGAARPDLATLPPEQTVAILLAYAAEVGEHFKKKQPTIMAAIEAQRTSQTAATATTSGSSSSP